MSRIRIGELLVKSGNITKKQLEKALKKQEEEGGLLGEILVKYGYVHDKSLAEALTKQADES